MGRASPIITALIGIGGGFLFGYDTGIMSVAKKPILEEFSVEESDTVITGFVTSIALFGAMFGSLMGGAIIKQFGRKIGGFIGTSICLFGGITQAFSPELWVFMLLRFILGIGIGLVAVVCPLYVAENAPQERRGTYGVLFQLSLTFGILVSYVAGFAFNQIGKMGLDWRLMTGTGGAASALFLMYLVFFGMEESSFGSIINDSSFNPHKENFFGLFRSFKRLKDTFLAIVLASTLQFTGINAIMYYGPTIIEQAGLNNPDALNIGIGAWNFAATFLAIYFVDRLSRKVLVVVGTGVMSIALIVVGIFLDSHIVSDPTTKGIGVAVGLALFLMGFEAGVGCLFWVLVNEIFDPEVVEHGAAFANVLQWGFNLAVSSFFPILFTDVGGDKTFYIFGGIGVICAFYLLWKLELKPRY